jgi:hypothetical protein
VRHRFFTLDVLYRMSGSEWRWAPPGGNAGSVFAADVVHLDAALPDSPDLAYGSGRVRHQNVTLDELGRISGSKLGWAPPGGKFRIGAVGGGVDAALPDLPDLVTRLCRVMHQNVTFDELGRISASNMLLAFPGDNRNQFPNDFSFISRLIVCIEFSV